jgi:hypothetical protein
VQALHRERRTETRALSVSVWDVNDAIPDLAVVVAAMNNAQPDIEFCVASLSAPYGLWKASATDSDRAYLPAERTAKRLKPLVASTRSNYLLCVTNLALADTTLANRYLWYRDHSHDRELEDNRVILFSIANFHPPLRGHALQRALANMAVKGLAGILAPKQNFENKRGTIGYKNVDRRVEDLAGPLTLGTQSRQILTAELRSRELPVHIVDSLEAILKHFEPPPDEDLVGEPTRPKEPVNKQEKQTGRIKKTPSAKPTNPKSPHKRKRN